MLICVQSGVRMCQPPWFELFFHVCGPKCFPVNQSADLDSHQSPRRQVSRSCIAGFGRMAPDQKCHSPEPVQIHRYMFCLLSTVLRDPNPSRNLRDSLSQWDRHSTRQNFLKGFSTAVCLTPPHIREQESSEETHLDKSPPELGRRRRRGFHDQMNQGRARSNKRGKSIRAEDRLDSSDPRRICRVGNVG